MTALMLVLLSVSALASVLTSAHQLELTLALQLQLVPALTSVLRLDPPSVLLSA